MNLLIFESLSLHYLQYYLRIFLVFLFRVLYVFIIDRSCILMLITNILNLDKQGSLAIRHESLLYYTKRI